MYSIDYTQPNITFNHEFTFGILIWGLFWVCLLKIYFCSGFTWFPRGIYFGFTKSFLLKSIVRTKMQSRPVFILPSYCLYFMPLVCSKYTCSVCFRGSDQGLLQYTLWVYYAFTLVYWSTLKWTKVLVWLYFLLCWVWSVLYNPLQKQMKAPLTKVLLF